MEWTARNATQSMESLGAVTRMFGSEFQQLCLNTAHNEPKLCVVSSEFFCKRYTFCRKQSVLLIFKTEFRSTKLTWEAIKTLWGRLSKIPTVLEC